MPVVFPVATSGDRFGVWTVLALGGSLAGGAYGPAYTGPTLASNEDVPGAVDFRAVYRNVLRKHLGVDPAPVFSEAWAGDAEVPLFGP